MRACRRGFTLIELTIVLALISVMMGLVLVRFSMGSTRQQVIQSARRIGNLLSIYREKAIEEEALYAMQLDLDDGTYKVVRLEERSAGAIQDAKALTAGRLDQPLKFGKTSVQLQEVASQLTIFFDSKGILPDLSIEVAAEGNATIVLKPDPFINEVRYDER